VVKAADLSPCDWSVMRSILIRLSRTTLIISLLSERRRGFEPHSSHFGSVFCPFWVFDFDEEIVELEDQAGLWRLRRWGCGLIEARR
jgi:hypothetical protein